MKFLQKRPYRKNLSAQGLIAVDGLRQAVTIKNISLTGALAELQNHTDVDDLPFVLANSTTLEIQIPDLKLKGQAEIVRIENKQNQIALGLKFKKLWLNSDVAHKNRKAYRKKLTLPGEILIQGNYQGFVSVNVSQDGMMIHLAKSVQIAPGEVTKFRFKQMGVAGEFKIIWIDSVPRVCTWIGGRCLGMIKEKIFAPTLPKLAANSI